MTKAKIQDSTLGMQLGFSYKLLKII